MLWPAKGQEVYAVGRDEQIPAPLSLVVRHLWSVTWRRSSASSFRPEVLSHPVSHLTFEDAASGQLHGHPTPAALVHGLVTAVFTVDLPVAGRVSGVAFHPGALVALLGVDAKTLTDRVVPAAELFGRGVEHVSRLVQAEPDEAARGRLALAFVEELLDTRGDRVTGDTAYATVRAAVDLMRAREAVSLLPIAEQVCVSPRTLQRIFARYVGVSPLWVLRRYRLQDAAAAIDAGEGTDLARLATDLGFADQAHFTRSFSTVIGVPPSRYREGRRASV